MKRKTLIVAAVLTIVVGGSAYGSLRGPDAEKVRTTKVEQVEHLRSLVRATGEIRAKEFVDIQAEVPGLIVELAVREGDQVEKGAMLLRLDDLQLKAEVDSARAQVGSAEAAAEDARVGVATAEANLAGEQTALANLRVDTTQAEITCERAQASLRRKRELFDSQLLGSEEFEIATAEARIAEQRLEWNKARVQQGEAILRAMESRVAAAKAQVEGAVRRVEAAKAALARATDQLGKTVLRSPLSGLVTKLNVEQGERAVPGIQSNPIATLMTIADMSVIEAEIQVAEADIVDVQLGMAASVEVDALRDVQIAGTVTEIGLSPIQPSGSAQGVSGGQSQEGKDFKVVIRLERPPATLRPGFTAQAEIVTATRSPCLVLPLQALTAREVQIDGKGDYVPPPEPESGAVVVAAPSRRDKKEIEGVFLIRDGRAHFRPVKTGISGDMDIEVLAGLTAGDEVISGPYQMLRKLEEWDHVVLDDKHKPEDDAVRKRRQRR